MASKPTRKPFHSDARESVAAVSLGIVKDVDKRNARWLELGLHDTIEMFQMTISGVTGPVWATIPVDFDYQFFYSPGTHDSELEVPNFAYGAELDQPVNVQAHIVEWVRDANNDAVIGAVVRVGVSSPEYELVDDVVTMHAQPFNGSLHLQFTGWATLYEDETEMQAE